MNRHSVLARNEGVVVKTAIGYMLVTVLLFGGFFFAYSVPVLFEGEVSHGSVHNARQEVETAPARILFVGDVFLGRAVERALLAYGSEYPYQYVANLSEEHAYQFGNFESAVPVEHVPTPDLTYRFSVAKRHLAALRDAGFTHVSLANNHSYDFGIGEKLHTEHALQEYGIVAFGDTYTIGTSSLTELQVDGINVAVVALDYTQQTPDEESLQNIFHAARQQSNVVIAYVHWGNEYELTHSWQQREIAATLSQFGVDIIIGHHPHVVQDIEVVNNTLVFYSLGNFIFDQYFSDEVQQGLALSYEPVGRRIELIPVTSIGSRHAPREMAEYERTLFLNDLAKRSDEALKEQILAASIPFSPKEHFLAVSP